MDEMDETEPIESVKASLSSSKEKTDQQNFCSNNTVKEQALDILMKDLSSCKLQLNSKESAYMKAVAELVVYQRTVAKLSTQLELSEADRDKYLEEWKKSQAFIYMLESEYEAIVCQFEDSIEDRRRLNLTLEELNHTKEELLQLRDELDAVEDSKVAALAKAELTEKAVNVDKEKNKGLLAHVSELNETILSSDLAATEAEDRLAFFAGIEAELQAAMNTATQSQEQLDQMKMQLVMMNDLGKELLEKTVLADYYQLELMQTKKLLATNMELMQTVLSNERNYSISIEAEALQLEEELRNAKGKASDLNNQVDKLTGEIQYMKCDFFGTKERELELQVEIATLKSDIHRNRSRVAAAEAAVARAMSAQSGLHLAMQQLALEAETAKKEVATLKLEMSYGITISVEEYESLIQKAKMADEIDIVPPSKDESQFLESVDRMEVDVLREELDAANAEISDLKFTLEETSRRAELADNAKSAIEDQLRQWRENRKLRRAASEASQEHSGRSAENEKPSGHNKHRTTSLQDGKFFSYVPLGKFLNMKF